MDLVTDLAAGLASGLGYAAVGIVLLALGYKVIDALTPGDLNQLVYEQRNRNAALLAASGLFGIGLLAVSFKVVDALTPGDLGLICTDADAHPAIWVTAVSHIVMGAVLAAAIS